MDATTDRYTQLRDTQFGHLVRFLSRRRYLQYPDEVDPSLWQRSLMHRGTGDGREKLASADHPDRPPVNLDHQTTDDPPASNLDSSGSGANLERVVEDGRDVYLVDWYGPNDPEVSQHPLPNWYDDGGPYC